MSNDVIFQFIIVKNNNKESHVNDRQSNRKAYYLLARFRSVGSIFSVISISPSSSSSSESSFDDPLVACLACNPVFLKIGGKARIARGPLSVSVCATPGSGLPPKEDAFKSVDNPIYYSKKKKYKDENPLTYNAMLLT